MESKSIFSMDFYSLREKDIKNGENKEGQGIVRSRLDNQPTETAVEEVWVADDYHTDCFG